jgi:hypothetical protein
MQLWLIVSLCSILVSGESDSATITPAPSPPDGISGFIGYVWSPEKGQCNILNPTAASRAPVLTTLQIHLSNAVTVENSFQFGLHQLLALAVILRMQDVVGIRQLAILAR